MGSLETHDLSLLGPAPPVHIVAKNCGVVTVNYRVIIDVNESEPLRRETESPEMEGAQAQGGA